MTVEELRKELESWPADTPVFVNGYEYGFQPPGCVRETILVKTADKVSMGGNYDEACEWAGIDDPPFRALIIDRHDPLPARSVSNG